MENVRIPRYSQIALSIAERIANGDIKEDSKMSGRSILSTEYGVSPETIRKSISLLSDMEVVEIKANVGIVVISRSNAQKYVERFSERRDLLYLQNQLKKSIESQESQLKTAKKFLDSLISTSSNFTRSNPFQNFEADIPKNSWIIDKSLGEVHFWQKTNATVIAIKRGENILLSPGPYEKFLPGDTLIFVGPVTCVEAVNNLLK